MNEQTDDEVKKLSCFFSHARCPRKEIVGPFLLPLANLEQILKFLTFCFLDPSICLADPCFSPWSKVPCKLMVQPHKPSVIPTLLVLYYNCY